MKKLETIIYIVGPKRSWEFQARHVKRIFLFILLVILGLGGTIGYQEYDHLQALKKDLVPNPPASGTRGHNDKWGHRLRARNMDEPREKPARQWVMELGFKYPSLCMWSRGVATLGLKPAP